MLYTVYNNVSYKFLLNCNGFLIKIALSMFKYANLRLGIRMLQNCPRGSQGSIVES